MPAKLVGVMRTYFNKVEMCYDSVIIIKWTKNIIIVAEVLLLTYDNLLC